MSKIFYVANIRLPTEKAHGIQIMHMCKAFAELGHEVELLVPKRFTPIKDNPFAYYGIPESFTITKVWCLDAVRFGKIGFWVQFLTFAGRVAWYSLFKQGVFYTRDVLQAVFLKGMGKQIVWEGHMGHVNRLGRLLIVLRIKCVVITRGLYDLYLSLGVRESNLCVAPDGVDIGQFDISMSREEARQQLGFEKHEKLVLYTGHLYSWKGADTLAEAAKFLPEEQKIIFIGGTDGDVNSFKQKYESVEHISILGKKPYTDMPLYMRAADVLVIPNSAKEDISRLYTSPMKLFEYMASRTPIVASDLPSLREIVDTTTASLFRPDDPQSLAGALISVFAEYPLAEGKANKARLDVEKYSWKKRAENIIHFI